MICLFYSTPCHIELGPMIERFKIKSDFNIQFHSNDTLYLCSMIIRQERIRTESEWKNAW